MPGPGSHQDPLESARRYTPAVEQSEQLPGVVQVIARHPAEAKGVEVAEGDGGENHHRSRHLVQLGDVGVLKVKLHAVHAHHGQHAHGAQEEESPQGALDAHALVGEHMRDAVQRGSAGENFNGGRLPVVQLLRLRFEIHSWRRGGVAKQKGGKKTKKNAFKWFSGEVDVSSEASGVTVCKFTPWHARIPRRDASATVRHSAHFHQDAHNTHPLPTYGSNQGRHR